MIGDSAGGQNQEQAIFLLNSRNVIRHMAKVTSRMAFFRCLCTTARNTIK